jgi:putative hydrolase of the HAD superfamily
VKTALICDTGFSPGRMVRKLLDSVGLLALLDAQVFSDEIGVPKPSPAMFRAALDAVGANPRDAVHVGDLRRTDVDGARRMGMIAVRYAGEYDDQAELPDGDLVIRRHDELLDRIELLPRASGSPTGADAV